MTKRPVTLTPSQTATLVSGGLDSFILWRFTRSTPVYVKWGAPYEEAELHALTRLSHVTPGFSPVIIDGPRVGHLAAPDGHVPHRNLLLLSTVAAHGYRGLYLAAVAGETSRDKTTDYMRLLENLLTYSECTPVFVKMPFHAHSKSNIVKFYLSAELDPYHLQLTTSCYRAQPEQLPCGACIACLRRYVAFKANHIEEHYAQDIRVWARAQKINLDYLLRAPLSDWPAIMRNNLEAWGALWK